MKIKRFVWGMLVLFCLFPSAALLYLSSSPQRALSFAGAVSAPLGELLSSLTSRVPFSLTELLLFLLLPLFFLLLVLLLRTRGSAALLLPPFLLLLLFSLYTLLFAPGQYAPPLAERLSLSTAAPSESELLGCAEWLSELASCEVVAPDDAELARRILLAYRKAGERCGIYVNREAVPKLSRTPLLFHLGYFGLYAFPLGEVTVARGTPPALCAFTAAHELSHAAGYLREEEADLLAFLICLDSGDDYLRYAGAVGMLGRLLTEVSDSAPAVWQAACEGLPSTARRELSGEGGASAPAGAVPQPEYGETVRLLCAVYRSRAYLGTTK